MTPFYDGSTGVLPNQKDLRDLLARGDLSLEHIAETPDENLLPPLDRSVAEPHNIMQAMWRKDGVVILEKFIPDELIDRYCALRAKLQKPGGWSCPVPYMYYEELRDIALYAPTMAVLKSLFGTDMGLHLNLTGWQTTARDWHQDDYLNPAFVNSWYAASWIALDDIHPDSGPFEFVRGSHRWPLLRREAVLALMTPEEAASPDWPTTSERILRPVFDEYINRMGTRVEQYIPKRGDMLLWHGRLTHRGSVARVPGTPRKALISHYSALSHRPDMPKRERWRNGSWYFLHGNALDAGSPEPTI